MNLVSLSWMVCMKKLKEVLNSDLHALVTARRNEKVFEWKMWHLFVINLWIGQHILSLSFNMHELSSSKHWHCDITYDFSAL